MSKGWSFLEKLPAKERKSSLLTGGSAAFLYGSDRPFSDDIDFMVSEANMCNISRRFDICFSFYRKKPVFHSLKAPLNIKKNSYDIIVQSIIQPLGRREEYLVHLTGEIIRKKVRFSYRGKTIYLIPKELLVLIKLLAGRGKELKKYDLYDVEKILSKNKDFNFTFFKKLIKEFCKPLELSVPLLLKNARNIPAKKNKNLKLLVQDLEKLL